MANYFILKKRSKRLFVIELIISSLVISVWLCKKFGWDWVTGLIIYFVSTALISYLFFRVRIFRYIVSILFSLIWAFLGFAMATALTRSKVSPWLLMGFVFIVSTVFHKGYFDFERKATRIEYEER